MINFLFSSINVTIISKHISLKFSSNSVFSEIFPIKIKISWKFFLKILGSQFDTSLIESKQIFKFSLSFCSKHFNVVSKTLYIKSLNCFASFFDKVPHNISVRHCTVFAFNDKELLWKYIWKLDKKTFIPFSNLSLATEYILVIRCNPNSTLEIFCSFNSLLNKFIE